MAKQTYSKEERKAQFLATGLKLARKNGIAKVSAAAVAAEHNITAPLVFHIFGSRDKLQSAIKREAKKLGVTLAEPKAAAPAPKRKRTVAEVKAIKDKAAGKRATTPAKVVKKAVPAKKAAAPKATPAKKAAPAKVVKYPTMTPPTAAVDLTVNAEPKATL